MSWFNIYFEILVISTKKKKTNLFIDLLVRFSKCGNEEKYPDHLIPSLIDVPGLENEDTEIMREILKLLFNGQIPSGTALIDLQRYLINLNLPIL